MQWFDRRKRIGMSLLGGTPFYDGIGGGRRALAWQVGNPGAVAALAFTRTNCAPRAAIWYAAMPGRGRRRAFVSNAIGTGIKPQSMLTDQAQREAIHSLWWDWCEEADAAGLTDFYGLQALACRAMLEGGECLVRLRYRRPEDGLPVGLQLQLLEPEHLPAAESGLASGNVIRAASNSTSSDGGWLTTCIARTRATARWPRCRAPVAWWAVSTLCVPRPAKSSTCFVPCGPDRSGANRGWRARWSSSTNSTSTTTPSWCARKPPRCSRASSRACPRGQPDGRRLPDASGAAMAGLEPGTMQILEPGEDVKFSQPADVGASYAEFLRMQFRAVAAAMGITYEMLTGDLTWNYSSIRAGLLEFRRRCEAIQHGVIVHQLCRPIWRAWMEQACLKARWRCRSSPRRSATTSRPSGFHRAGSGSIPRRNSTRC
jgi:capsid protein